MYVLLRPRGFSIFGFSLFSWNPHTYIWLFIVFSLICVWRICLTWKNVWVDLNWHRKTSHVTYCFYLYFSFLITIVHTKSISSTFSGVVEKSSKIAQEKESLISVFACFLTAIAKCSFWKGDWALGYVFIEIWDFSNIS